MTMLRNGGKRERKPFVQIEINPETSDRERDVLHRWIQKCWIGPMTRTGSKWLGTDKVP
jgi:hypothetical protein